MFGDSPRSPDASDSGNNHRMHVGIIDTATHVLEQNLQLAPIQLTSINEALTITATRLKMNTLIMMGFSPMSQARLIHMPGLGDNKPSQF